ncbi:glycosyltransferase family 4 protein [Streptomyces sp. NPDC051018]|uniref:glycosyltransferase family 4 protein n=1 Tax=Streptomyces sp. NPDC051018 TaxID=3365639 RepID=UPI0037BC523B
MPKTLIITNDFPPRQGGIETFVHAMATRFPADSVAVYTSAEPGAHAYDDGLPFPVVRDPSRTLLPTRRTTDRAVGLIRELDCDRVWFGAAAPLGLMAAALRRRTRVQRLVATTHGHEVWWARTPGARTALRRIGATTDTVTCLGDHTRRIIASALDPAAASRMRALTPGVDPADFAPDPDSGRSADPGTGSGRTADPAPATGRTADPGTGRAALRRRYGIAPDAPVVLCAARLVPRKGQDTLIRALPLVHRSVPGATLLLVGSGPYESRLRRLIAAEGVRDTVVLAGGHPHTAMPAFYAAADVFAMPCRTRRLGMEVEGLGIVSLEAAAAGLPVLTGASGGAPDTVREGETGHVVDGRGPEPVADRLIRLLGDREAAADMGRKGREWVASQWTWARTYRQLAALLAYPD